MRDITFIIPALPECDTTQAVQAILDLDYPQDRIEVLVVRGSSPSLQRNEAAARASGDLLYFIDDDSYIDPGALRNAIQLFGRPEIAAVGGPALTCSDASWLEHAFGAAIASWFGTGPARARSRVIGGAREVRGEELILCNLLIRKDVFLGASGFDVRLYPNEENELLKRLRKSGYRFMYSPQMVVNRPRRKIVRDFVRQMFFYGWGRSRHIFKHFELGDLLFLIPSIFLCYLLLLPLLIFRDPSWAFPCAAYGALAFLASCRASIRSGRLSELVTLPPIFALMHISYGIGLLSGVFGWRRSSRKTFTPVLTEVIKPLLPMRALVG